MDAAEVLGIPVRSRLLRRWREWFAPPSQPFRTDLLSPVVSAAIPDYRAEPTDEWRDTFFMYAGTWTWLDEAAFMALRPSHRRALLAVRRRIVRPKRMPVWPSDLERAGDQLMLSWVASGVRSSRHRVVPIEVWDRAAHLLPNARRLAGTFASTGSGANCFGTVMAASAISEVEDIRVAREPFQTWLGRHTEPIEGTAHDGEPGIVFVWTEHGDLAHATVTVGDGWMLSKPSQSWSSPRLSGRCARQSTHGGSPTPFCRGIEFSGEGSTCGRAGVWTADRVGFETGSAEAVRPRFQESQRRLMHRVSRASYR